jgi:holo-[acyl-carrier protein] synthase
MRYIGVDIIEVARIEKAIACWGERFLQRVYTDFELRLCGNSFSSLAVRFAGKEAVIKALGGLSPGFNWKEIEILSDTKGKPLVHLHGNTQSRAESLGLDGFAISLSDCEQYAIAFVVGETK